jgi:undecaprenyl pyrophosphate phosphatase UppP
MEDGDPHEEIMRLEAQIEEFADKIESCRKFILAAQIAVAGGSVALAALLLAIVRFDPVVLVAACAAVLGGIVIWGSNRSTAEEAKRDLARAEADRAALIGLLDLQLVAPNRTLH